MPLSGYAHAWNLEMPTHEQLNSPTVYWVEPSSAVYGIRSVVQMIGNGSPSRPSAGMIFGRSSSNSLRFRSANFGSFGP